MNILSVFRNLHLILAVLFGLFAAAVGLSGSALVFREEIEHAVYEPIITVGTTMVPFATLSTTAAALDSARRVSMMVLPIAADRSVEFVLQKRNARSLKGADQMSVYVNPYTGHVIGSRRREASVIAMLRDLHFAFFSGTSGLVFNGYVACALLFMSITGLYLWLVVSPRSERFSLRFGGNWKRVVWNLHRQSGALSLAALALVATTGAHYAFREPSQRLMLAVTGSAPPRSIPIVTPPLAGSAPRDLDAIVGAARAAFSDGTLAVVRVPSKSTQAWAATFHRDGDGGESTDSGPTVYVNPFTLDVMRVDDARIMPFGARLEKSMETLHYGKFGGVASRLFWVVLGVLPLLFMLSGALMWWQRAGRRLARGTGRRKFGD